MSNIEVQNEEREVLLSIYEGDPSFKQLSPTVFQYKFGEHDTIKSFLLELQWGGDYPNEKPQINMNTFYNTNLVDSVKNKIIDFVSTESEQYIGEAMTYSLFERVKEEYDELIKEQPEFLAREITEDVEKLSVGTKEELPKKVKKEHLTKAQKRRQWDKIDSKGEKPRGWDWVDIVKHLSQTGTKDSENPTAST